MNTVEEKKRELRRLMEKYAMGPVCIAFSGGVDSSLLLKLACDAAREQGTEVYAVTFHTMLHPACDLETAKRVAGELGAHHEVIQVNELELTELQNNPPDRCYLCKHHLFCHLTAFADEKGITCLLDGTNEDDLHVYRPGLRALKELGIQSPLALCGMTKKEVKEMAAELGISVASRPSTPCMATRLPYGTHIEYETLRRIENGEAYLRKYFKGNVRLRLHEDVARIELDKEEMRTALELQEEISRELRKLGFTYITIDLEGFRSGSMDVGVM